MNTVILTRKKDVSSKRVSLEITIDGKKQKDFNEAACSLTGVDSFSNQHGLFDNKITFLVNGNTFCIRFNHVVDWESSYLQGIADAIKNRTRKIREVVKSYQKAEPTTTLTFNIL